MRPVDDNGFPGAIGLNGEFDGGDTAAILGTLSTLSPNRLWDYKITHLVDLGYPIRHPDHTKWYGQPDRFSRDQLIPLICAAITPARRLVPFIWMERLYNKHKQQLFLLAWNRRGNGAMDKPLKSPDFCGPEVWALWIRYKRPWWGRLVLWLLDLESLGSAIHWRFWRKDFVCRNHMLVSITCRKHMPTWVSRITYRINNWPDLIGRWRAHCIATREYDTSDLFEEAIR